MGQRDTDDLISGDIARELRQPGSRLSARLEAELGEVAGFWTTAIGRVSILQPGETIPTMPRELVVQRLRALAHKLSFEEVYTAMYHTLKHIPDLAETMPGIMGQPPRVWAETYLAAMRGAVADAPASADMQPGATYVYGGSRTYVFRTPSGMEAMVAVTDEGQAFFLTYYPKD
jgi:hypothetical protein